MSSSLSDISRETNSLQNGIPPTPSSAPVKEILLAGVWFGLVTGLVEGVGLWSMQRLGWLSVQIMFLGSSIDGIWISLLFDLLLFCAIGLMLALLARIVPRLPILRMAIFVYACLALFIISSMLLVGRIRVWAIPILVIGLVTALMRLFEKRQEAIQRFWQRSTPWLGALALLALLGIPGGLYLKERQEVASLPEEFPTSPNIVVIVVDSLRADHLSSYGYTRRTSPNVDLLAQQGVVFENAFSTAPWTKPSHASLLTGHYTSEHGADVDEPLDDRLPTLGEEFQARGYRTGAFSANYEVFNRRQGFGRGFHHFEDDYRSLANMVTHTLIGRLVEYYVLHQGFGLEYKLDRKLAPDVNQAVVRWIDRDPSKPFFAFLNYFDVHAPYTPPQPYRSMFSELENPGGLINTDWDLDHIYLPMTSEQIQGEIDAYDGAIGYVDEHIRQLLDSLQQRGISENTIVVITSDHGEMFGEHGLFEHNNSLYREVLHVPLIVSWAGHLPAGERIQRPVSIVNLPATLLDLIGDDDLAPFSTDSLARLWEEPDTATDWPNPLAEASLIPWVPQQHLTSRGAMKSVVSPEWHYIVHEELGEELYAWPTDPSESIDLARDEELQSTLESLRTEVRSLAVQHDRASLRIK
jgi:arylsulfatase A-like enzyme